MNKIRHKYPKGASLSDASLSVRATAFHLISEDHKGKDESPQISEQIFAITLQTQSRTVRGVADDMEIHIDIQEADTASNAAIEILEAAIFRAAGESDDGHELYEPVYYRSGAGDRTSPDVRRAPNNEVTLNLKSPGEVPYCFPIYFKGLTSLKLASLKISLKIGNRKLVAGEAPVHTTPISNPSPISWALEHSWEPVLKRTGELIDPQSSTGRATLSWAAINGNIGVIEHLKTMTKGDLSQESIEHKDEKGRTPLSLAAGNGREDVVQLLVEAGADIRSKDNQQISPLTWAAMHYIPNYEADKRASRDDNTDSDKETKHSLSTGQEMPNGRIVAFLVNKFKTLDPPEPYWELQHLHQAARCGMVDAVKTFLSLELCPVDGLIHSEGTKGSKTALCLAAERGHSETVDLLLSYGAYVDYVIPESRDTPLLLAISSEVNEGLKVGVVDVLLERGADIFTKNANEETAIDLAVNNRLQSIATRVLQRSKDGSNAGSIDQLDHDVDCQFSATIVTFKDDRGHLKRLVSKKAVNEFLGSPRLPPEEAKSVAFQWLHLPANNMRWVEVLMAQLCQDGTQAYRILKPERWVRRQHQRMSEYGGRSVERGEIHHARFMRPLCQAFRTVPSVPSSAQDYTRGSDRHDLDTDLVLFMPYLHWDVTGLHKKREEAVKQLEYLPVPSPSWNLEQEYLNSYLFHTHESRSTSRLGNSHMHQAHVRRTLDQYYYYDLDSTEKRDRDQVISRAACQRLLPEDHKVLTMVDQLWLWMLADNDGQPATVVTCFPHKGPQLIDETQVTSPRETNTLPNPDPSGSTNLLTHILLHMTDHPQSVETASGLAKLIVTKCSRTYMDSGSQEERLRFKEAYEEAIGCVVRQETKLFDDFTKIMTDVRDRLKHLQNQRLDGEDFRQREQWRTKEIYDVLDITNEVQLLHQIKDVQDELRIMARIFQDQKVIANQLETILYSLTAKGEKVSTSSSETKNLSSADLRDISVDLVEVDQNKGRNMTADSREASGQETYTKDVNEHEVQGPKATEHLTRERTTVRVGNNACFNSVGGAPPYFVGTTDLAIGNNAHFTTTAPEPAEVLEGQPETLSSLLATVDLSIDEIENMIEGASDANASINQLIDLKQKQSNVMDARSTRIQTDESLKMTAESEKQGKTIMVFTIVTIIFLPLSFMAAFFAIDIAQFTRVDGDRLSLGYVSEFMFPISAFITAFLIYVAFNIETLQNLWPDWKAWAMPKIKQDEEAGNGN